MSTFLALLALLLVVGVGVGVGLGVLASLDRVAVERQHLQEREAAVQAEWNALRATNRIGWAFWLARQRMLDEARRHQHW